jgi:predicted alpha/beta superfamily hydrolase
MTRQLPVYFLFCLLIIFMHQGYAQVTLRIISLPKNTPEKPDIFVAGSLNGWNPGDNNFSLKQGGDGIWAITIPEGKGKIEYKITRGDWSKAEGGPKGEEIGNRSFTFTGIPQIIDLTIQSWKEKLQSTAQPNVQILDTAFFMSPLNRTRRIWLYLPPDYATGTKRYPVIYMHDGQNLFDQSTSFSGEWEIDETLNHLQKEGDYGAIVVGIDNGARKRLDEYSPWANKAYGGGEGDEYIDFIRDNLKPFIDQKFRTKSTPEYTCLWGSSMGGLISTYGVLKYPETFGKAGVFSPSYWFSFDSLTQTITTKTSNLERIKIIHVAGEKEGANMKVFIHRVNDALTTQKIPVSNLKVKIDTDGTHTEGYWKREFAEAYKWLFSK